MSKFILIGAGGFVGAVLRYVVSGAAQSLSHSAGFPYGTLVVNLSGCLIIGFLARLADLQGLFSADARLFLFIGVLGAFTTFSTFGNETYALLQGGEIGLALLNVGASVLAGLAAVWVGHGLATWIAF
ncbi:MAG: fluoride efflux transporter CrcB [Caldilineales bacterium]|nr:fluoride efflux transporter CrcB [Caldilineales bacterium]